MNQIKFLFSSIKIVRNKKINQRISEDKSVLIKSHYDTKVMINKATL